MRTGEWWFRRFDRRPYRWVWPLAERWHGWLYRRPWGRRYLWARSRRERVLALVDRRRRWR